MAYGVEVGTLIDAAEAAEQEDSTAVISIKGYVGTGTTPESGTGDLGTISLPLQMVQRHPGDNCLRVIGDSLVPHGIHDGDVLLVCPDQPPPSAAFVLLTWIADYARSPTSRDRLRMRTATGTNVDL